MDLDLQPGMSKRTSYGKIYRSDVRARPRFSRRRVFNRDRVFTVCADGKKTRLCGRANASARTRSYVRADIGTRPHLPTPYPRPRPPHVPPALRRWTNASVRTRRGPGMS
jgi:hypothetical protein